MVAVVKDVQPKDQLEAMLAAQMAVAHTAAMSFAQKLGDAETLAHQDSAERALNKLMRTFAMQLETLKRYRSGGEPTVHVSVNDGGKAIVGNVTHAANQNQLETPTDLRPALPDRRQPAMAVIGDEERAPAVLPAGEKL
jgi:hypothetical protein